MVALAAPGLTAVAGWVVRGEAINTATQGYDSVTVMQRVVARYFADMKAKGKIVAESLAFAAMPAAAQATAAKSAIPAPAKK